MGRKSDTEGTKKIQIRTKSADPLDREMSWLTFYVEHESDAAVHINNRVMGDLHTETTLVKLPNGNLANSAGQEFEIREEKDWGRWPGGTRNSSID